MEYIKISYLSSGIFHVFSCKLILFVHLVRYIDIVQFKTSYSLEIFLPHEIEVFLLSENDYGMDYFLWYLVLFVFEKCSKEDIMLFFSNPKKNILVELVEHVLKYLLMHYWVEQYTLKRSEK
jgi:hypothetical protein